MWADVGGKRAPASFAQLLGKLKQKKCLFYYVGPRRQSWMLMVWKKQLNFSTSIPLHVVVMQHMVAEGHP